MPSESGPAGPRDDGWGLDRGWALSLLAAITLIGLGLRLGRVTDPLFGDELSTLYVARNSFGEVLDLVSSDAEISPPLYFVLAWLSTQLGGVAELIRLPSLLAGVASIPLTYALGTRAVGRATGLIGATLMALSPFMIFFSTDGRAYAVAIALLLGSTLTMLIAAEGGRGRTGETILGWWIGYALLSCLAMYAHYTSAFVLIAQLGWLAWAHREVIRPALLANVGAAILFIPWLPSAIADNRSPTIAILEALQGSGFSVKAEAFAIWIFGYPFVQFETIPGWVPFAIAVAAIAVALLTALARWAHPMARRSAARSWRPAPGVALLVVIGLATPIAELALLAVGTDLFGARNLNTSSAGISLAIAAVLSSAGPMVGGVCTAAVVLTFAIGSVRALGPSGVKIPLDQAAEFIDAEAEPEDVVVDTVSAAISPVPLTPVRLYMEREGPEYNLFLPLGPPPYLTRPPPATPLLREAVDDVGTGRLFIVSNGPVTLPADSGPPEEISVPSPTGGANARAPLPPGSSVVDREVWGGSITVTVIDPGSSSAAKGAA